MVLYALLQYFHIFSVVVTEYTIDICCICASRFYCLRESRKYTSWLIN